MRNRKIVLIMMFAIYSILWSFNTAAAEIFMSVSGKVSDEITGQGIQGATVFLEDAIQQGNKRQVTTSATGNFKFEFIRAGKYSLYIFAPAGYVNVITPIPVEIISGKNIIDLNVTLKKGGSISGIVYQSDGVAPLSTAVVSAMARDGSVGVGVSNANGSYVINGLTPSNAYRVMVNIIGHATVMKQNVPVISNQTTSLNIILAGSLTEIKGVVTDAGSIPIQGATVLLSPMIPQANSEISNAVVIGVTDINGNFSLKGLIPGVYKAVVKASNYDTVEQLNINVTLDGPIVINFTLKFKIGRQYQDKRFRFVYSNYRLSFIDNNKYGLGFQKELAKYIDTGEKRLLFQFAACGPSGPGPSPDRGSPESELAKCLQEAALEYAKDLAHALQNEIIGQIICAALIFVGGPPAVAACEIGLQMLTLAEVALAVVALQGRQLLCQQQYNDRLNEPPSPPGGPCDCQGPDCHQPDRDRPDDWKGVPPDFIKTHFPILRDNSLMLAI